MENYGVPPGILRRYLKNGDWVLYSAQELAKLTGNTEKLGPIMKIRKRLKYGVRKELVPLTDIKGIGRVRARRLYEKDIKEPKNIKETDYLKLANLLGPKTAKKIKERLGQEVEQDPEQIKSTEPDTSSRQRSISDY